MLRSWNRSISRLKTVPVLCTHVPTCCIPSCEDRRQHKVREMSRSWLRRLCETHWRTLLHRGLFASVQRPSGNLSLTCTYTVAYCVKTKQASGVVEIIDVAVLLITYVLKDLSQDVIGFLHFCHAMLCKRGISRKKSVCVSVFIVQYPQPSTF